jgi:HK97 family phage major capsid protein
VNYETTQFTTGSGSAPHGVVADVTAITASRVSPATGGAFVVGDVYKLQSALPATVRNADPRQRAWIANVAVIDAMRQFATANNTASFLTELGGGQPTRLLGDGLYEVSAMDSAITTGSNALLAGDFSRFLIIDRLGLTTEFLPNVWDQASGRPSGTRAYLCHFRVGSVASDPNAFRVLKL